MRIATFAHRRCKRRGRAVTSLPVDLDVGGTEGVGRSCCQRLLEPRFSGDIVPSHRVTIGSTVGELPPVAVTQPKVEIDNAGIQDDAHPARGKVHALGRRRRCAVYRRNIRRLPSDVATALVEIAIDQLNGRLGKIDEALVARILCGLAGHGFKLCDLDRQIPVERPGDLPHLIRDDTDFLSEDRKDATRLTRALRFNQRIQRKSARTLCHLLDLFDLLTCQLTDLRLRDEVSDTGIRFLARCGRRMCGS